MILPKSVRLNRYKKDKLKVFGDTSAKGWNDGYKCSIYTPANSGWTQPFYGKTVREPPKDLIPEDPCNADLKEMIDTFDTNKDGKVSNKEMCKDDILDLCGLSWDLAQDDIRKLNTGVCEAYAKGTVVYKAIDGYKAQDCIDFCTELHKKLENIGADALP